jgi:hypothetical protein
MIIIWQKMVADARCDYSLAVAETRNDFFGAMASCEWKTVLGTIIVDLAVVAAAIIHASCTRRQV